MENQKQVLKIESKNWIIYESEDLYSDVISKFNSLFQNRDYSTAQFEGFDDKTLQNPCTVFFNNKEIPFLKISLLKIPSELL